MYTEQQIYDAHETIEKFGEFLVGRIQAYNMAIKDVSARKISRCLNKTFDIHKSSV